MTDNPSNSDSMGTTKLSAGKLPPNILGTLLDGLDNAEDVLIGPGVGRDVAVVSMDDDRCLVLTSDPITFATDRIGWYAVNVNANDIATVGARPRWFLATVLLPAGEADAQLATTVMHDLREAATALGIQLVGGHTEITDVPRVIVSGTMIGEVSKQNLIRPDGLLSGDAVVLAGGMAIEATSIIAREFPDRLRAAGISDHDFTEAAGYLDSPGISVTRIAGIATNTVSVHAMHDPTEGGVVTALDELATAAGRTIIVDPAVLRGAISPLSAQICAAVGIDPLGAISSGALLIGVSGDDAGTLIDALRDADVPAWKAGTVADGSAVCVIRDSSPWPRFQVDEITRLF
jgi:hydrogenase expression/formation protein HypE